VTHEGPFDSIVGAGLAPCRSSGPFLSGPEERPRLRTGEWEGSLTAGSPEWSPGRISTRLVTSSPRQPPKTAVIRFQSGWMGGYGKAPEVPTIWCETLNGGVTPARPMFLWTPWDLS
jgi:hypothetical protein